MGREVKKGVETENSRQREKGEDREWGENRQRLRDYESEEGASSPFYTELGCLAVAR